MTVVGVRELRDRAAKILRQVEKGEPAIVTRHGRPVATILPLTDEELEDWALSHHPEARKRLEEARARARAGEVVTAEELRKDLADL